MTEYTYQVLRVVVAQICQTIGWHSIQSTPLELLVDILHKYLQEITRETYRHTELYGRTEPNITDIGLAFRNININLSDIEEYINYVDSVPCSLEVPKYPIRKDSNLNFLKPGSKEVLTRPVHIPEYLPPIYPEKEEKDAEPVVQREPNNYNAYNAENQSASTNDNAIFKKPEINEGPINKKPRITFEEEGRPTREISSVMMTSSGFISPAREGKLPDAKTPVLPEYKPPPPPPVAPPVPASNIESKHEKKAKKKSGIEKEKKRDKAATEMLKSINQTSEFTVPHTKEKVKALKKQKNKQKHNKDAVIPSELAIAEQKSIPPLEAANVRHDGNVAAGEHQNKIVIDLNAKHNKNEEIKLSSEPSKEKLNIFKKITGSKKEKDDLVKSTSIFHDVHLLSSIPEGTTITPTPSIKSLPSSECPIMDDIIFVDDEPEYPAFTSNSSNNNNNNKAGRSPIIPQNLLPPGTTIKAQPTKKPRKNKQQQQQQPAQHGLEQSAPLNLSNEVFGIGSPINMVKKDLIQNSRLSVRNAAAATAPAKPFKEKKERKRIKIKEKKEHPSSKETSSARDPSVQGHGGDAASAAAPLMLDVPSTSSALGGSFAERNVRDAANFFTDYGAVNSAIPKMNTTPQNPTQQNANTYAAPPFTTPIPIFPFYPFPPRPGLIPSPGIFNTLQPLPGSPAFNKFLMRFRNFSNISRTRMHSGYDDKPQPLPPVNMDKTYCNVAPLVPDSMKFQLSPHAKTKTVSCTVTGTDDITSSVSKLNKNLKTQLDAPIEISDDEKPKSDTEDKIELPHQRNISGSNVSGNGGAAGSTGSNSNNNKATISHKGSTDDKTDLEEAEMITSDNELRESKSEKRKDREHKKGKKGKDGKIKKKKDKKDKSKSKDKAEKRKGKEGKKERDRIKKMKKEKKREKMKAQVLSIDDKHSYSAISGEPSSNIAVPKLTLKLGLGASPQPDSPDGRKIAPKSPSDVALEYDEGYGRSPAFGRRESSPELARISPLVTRPPKQKSSSNDNLGPINNVNSQICTDNNNRSINSNITGNQMLLIRKNSLVAPTPSSSSSTSGDIIGITSSSPSTTTKQQQYQQNDIVQLKCSKTSVDNMLLSSPPSSTTFYTNTNILSSNINNNDARKDDTKLNNTEQIDLLSSSTSSIQQHLSSSSSSTTTAIITSATAPATGSSSINISSSWNRHSNEITTPVARHHIVKNYEQDSLLLQQQQQQHSSVVKYLPNVSGSNNSLSAITSTTTATATAATSQTKTTLSAVESNRPSSYIDAEGNQVWICPACGKVDDGTPMIGCDGCDAWYHWVCVGIQVPPDDNEDWYCRVCIAKKQEAHGADKKRKRKKKNRTN